MAEGGGEVGRPGEGVADADADRLGAAAVRVRGDGAAVADVAGTAGAGGACGGICAPGRVHVLLPLHLLRRGAHGPGGVPAVLPAGRAPARGAGAGRPAGP